MKWNTKKIYDEQWPIFYYLLVWYEPSFPTAKEGLDNLENCLRATLSSNASNGQLFFYQKMMPWLRSVSHGYGAFANAILFQLKQGIRFHVMISFQFWLKFSDGLLSFFLDHSIARVSLLPQLFGCIFFHSHLSSPQQKFSQSLALSWAV